MSQSLLVNCIHNKLLKKADYFGHISKKELYMFLAINYKIPRKLVYPIIKELETMNVLKDLDKRKVLILPCSFDIDKDANKYYVRFNIF